MSGVVNISTKKVVRFVMGVLLGLLFMVLLVAASFRQQQKTIVGLEVQLNDAKEFSFLQKKDIKKLLIQNRHINLNQTRIEQLDLNAMEQIALTHPWVAKADIYVDNNAVLQVNVTQREPAVRIFDTKGNSYYMDTTFSYMPLSTGFAHPATVFTNVPVFGTDSLNRKIQSKLVYISNAIAKDTFWQAQVTQIEVQPNQTFVLSTLLGNQRILLGDTNRLSEKLHHLYAFYQQVSTKIGWDKYEVLDARFKGQIVASPTMGWVPPKVADTIPKPPLANVPVPSSVQAKSVKVVKVNIAEEKKEQSKEAVLKSNIAKQTKKVDNKAELKAAALTKKPKVEEKKTETKKVENKAQSPKYIYPAKKAGSN